MEYNTVRFEKSEHVATITLNRPDIFPSGDLGVQKGFQQYFKLKELPTPKTMKRRAEKWKPFRTVASLYFWKVVDGPFEW